MDKSSPTTIDHLGISSFDSKGNYIDRSSTGPLQIGITENHVFDLTNTSANGPAFDLSREDTATGSETPPPNGQEPIPPEQLRRMSIELVSNRMFREIGDRITK